MMNENEINRILEKTKEKIAISQFKEERIEDMKQKKNNKLIFIKRIGITTAAGMLLAVGSVGAYVGISGNYEILRKIGINIGEKYEEEKQDVKGNISQNGTTLNLVSAACDSSCIILEMDVKLDNDKYEDVDFKIDSFSLEGKKIKGSTDKNLRISENTVSSTMEDGTIKLFKYISVKDPNLAGDGFLDEVFSKSNSATCKIEFSKLYDVKTNKVILEGNWKFDFDLKGKENAQYTVVDKDIELEDVMVNIYSIAKSPLGNYITINAMQDEFDLNKDNNIQKLEFIVKNSKGEKVNIVSKTYNITRESEDNLNVGLEVTLKLDDISSDINYDIDVKVGEKCNISMNEIKEIFNVYEQQEKNIVEAEKVNEEIQMVVVEKEENSQNNQNNSFIVKSPLNRDLIILRRFDNNSHDGIDLMAEQGELIYAVNDGKVLETGFDEGTGNYIIIEHSNGLKTVYASCLEFLKQTGDEIKAGDAIAKVGSTGMSTGPHLHFEIRDYNNFKNPEDYLK